MVNGESGAARRSGSEGGNGSPPVRTLLLQTDFSASFRK